MSHVCIDFETFYSKKLKYSVKTMIAEQYCRHPLFDAYMISVCDGSQTWAGHPKDFNWEALDGKHVVAHNRYFDHNVWNELHRRGLCPKPNFSAFSCTANLTAYLCNRRALAPAMEYLYNERVDKDPREKAAGRQWETFTPEERAEMLQYAKHDARNGWRLWNDFAAKWPTVERELSDITIDQGMRGVQIDVALLNNYIIWTHEMKANAEKLLPWIEGADDADDPLGEDWDDFSPVAKRKPTSTKCIAEQCRRVGIPCPPVKSEDEEAYDEWEGIYSPLHPWIKALTAWRSINKLYKTFTVIKERLRSDGTLPFALKYFGAHTGRWSGDARVNMQNQRKRPIVCNEHGLLEMDDARIDAAMREEKLTGKLPAWVRYVIDFRHLILPRPGRKMIVSDLSQIEPRVLAWLADDSNFLDKIRKGDSPYVAHARASMGFAGDEMDKNSNLYKLAKARILALGYGAGWEKFIAMARDLARIDITADDPEWIEEEHPVTGEIKKVSGFGANSKRIVKEFRESNPKLAGPNGIWKMLDESMKRSIGGDFILTLPSGRQLKYEKVRCEARIEPDKETGKPKKKWVFTAMIGSRRFMTYGGKLTENATQAAARDVFAEHVVAMHHNGWDNLFSVHDEAVLEVDQSVTAKDVEHQMSKCPDWLKGCPIGAEAHEVKHYCK